MKKKNLLTALLFLFLCGLAFYAQANNKKVLTQKKRPSILQRSEKDALKTAKSPLFTPKTKGKTKLQKQFFHFHQTIGHLESWSIMRALKKQRCLAGLDRAKKHFQKVKLKSPRHPFWVWSLHLKAALSSAKKQQVSQLEHLRIQIHDIGEKLGLQHRQLEWRNEFSACRRKPQAQSLPTSKPLKRK